MLEFGAGKTPAAAMHSKKLKTEWLSLHVALAWVVTRDDAFTYQVARFSNPNLGSALALYNLGADKKVESLVENESKAWLKLREAISNRLVPARGMPYEKSFFEGRAHAEPEKEAGVLESEEAEWDREFARLEEIDRLEYGVDLAQEKIELPPSEVSNLVIDVDTFEMHLRPETVILSGGKWWRDVEVLRDDLIKAFPAQPASVPDAGARDYKLRQTMEALIAIYPRNGLPVDESEFECWRKVNNWFSENKHPDEKMPTSGWVSKPTIRRAKEKLRLRSQSP